SVNAEWMRAGVRFARYFVAQARVLYAAIAEDDAAQAVRPRRDRKAEILRLLREREHTRNELTDAVGRNVPAADIDRALGELASEGKASGRRGDPGPRGGRPPIIWFALSEVAS